MLVIFLNLKPFMYMMHMHVIKYWIFFFSESLTVIDVDQFLRIIPSLITVCVFVPECMGAVRWDLGSVLTSDPCRSGHNWRNAALERQRRFSTLFLSALNDISARFISETSRVLLNECRRVCSSSVSSGILMDCWKYELPSVLSDTNLFQIR